MGIYRYFFILLLAIYLTACTGMIGNSPISTQSSQIQSPFKNYHASNMQEASILIKNRTLESAQAISIDTAKKLLSKHVMEKIQSTYESCGVNTHKSLQNVKEYIQNYVYQEARLENTVVQPEGRLFVLISADFNEIANVLKQKIPEYINNNCLSKQITQEFVNED